MTTPGLPRTHSQRARLQTLTSLPRGRVSTGCVGELFLQRKRTGHQVRGRLQGCGDGPLSQPGTLPSPCSWNGSHCKHSRASGISQVTDTSAGPPAQPSKSLTNPSGWTRRSNWQHSPASELGVCLHPIPSHAEVPHQPWPQGRAGCPRSPRRHFRTAAAKPLSAETEEGCGLLGKVSCPEQAGRSVASIHEENILMAGGPPPSLRGSLLGKAHLTHLDFFKLREEYIFK